MPRIRILYGVTNNYSEIYNAEFADNSVEKFILTHFMPDYNAFSVSLISDLASVSRGRAKKVINKLEKLGFVKRLSGGYK